MIAYSRTGVFIGKSPAVVANRSSNLPVALEMVMPSHNNHSHETSQGNVRLSLIGWKQARHDPLFLLKLKYHKAEPYR